MKFQIKDLYKYGEEALNKFKNLKDEKEISKVIRTLIITYGSIGSIYIICKNGGISYGKLRIGTKPAIVD